MLKNTILILITASIFSCNGQPQSQSIAGEKQGLKRPENGFSSALLDRDGHLWFVSFGQGLYHFDGSTFTHLTEADGLCSNEVYTLLQDQKGTLWLGTPNGLCRYDGKTFTHLPIPFQDTSSVWLDQVYPIINPNAVHSMIQDQNEDFWIGTGGGGVYHFDGETFTPYLRNEGRKYEDSLYHNWIPDIMQDRAGNIWFASMSYGGLNRYDGRSFQQFLRKDGLSDDMIRVIFEDHEGKIWLGFNGNRKSALTVYDGESFHVFSLEGNACHRNIRTIFEDKNGNLWLGGEEGICIFDGSNFTDFKDKNGQSFSGIIFIIADENQHIWFGGRHGLWRYDGQEITDMTK